jgi:Flp pilus assembly protein TadD
MTPSRSLDRAARRGRGAATRACSGGVVSLAVMLAVGAGGCQSINPGSVKNAPVQSQPSGAIEPQKAATTDFHKDVSHEQGFNVHLELGRVFESQGNFEAAVAEYQKAVDIGVLKGSSHANARLGPAPRALAERRMAGAFDRMGRFSQAEVHYRKALELAPKDAKVWNDVGYSYYLQSRHADSERALKMADSFDPNNPRILTNLGLTLAAAGKTDDALKALSRAGGPAVGRANLGFILAALGKTDEARKNYEMALAIQPGLTPARRAIAQLDAQTRRVSATAVAAAPPPPPPPIPAGLRSQPVELAGPTSVRAAATAVAAAPTPPPIPPAVTTSPRPSDASLPLPPPIPATLPSLPALLAGPPPVRVSAIVPVRATNRPQLPVEFASDSLPALPPAITASIAPGVVPTPASQAPNPRVDSQVMLSSSAAPWLASPRLVLRPATPVPRAGLETTSTRPRDPSGTAATTSQPAAPILFSYLLPPAPW